MKKLLPLVLALAWGCGSEEAPWKPADVSANPGLPYDASAPTLTLDGPEEGATLTTLLLPVSGTALDDTGVAAIRYRLNGSAAVEVPIEAGKEVPFSFEAALLPGVNHLVVQAVDRVDRNVEEERSFTVIADEALPEIVSFTADAELIEPGQPVQLAWSVKGATELFLNGEPVSGDGITVTPAVSTTFRLAARNAAGAVRASVLVRLILPPLVLRPGPAILDVGGFHRLWIENALDGNGEPLDLRWTATGGVLIPQGLGTRVLWQPDAPGTYEITATSSEDPPREASVTVEVRELQPRIGAFVGIGGQPGSGSGLVASPAGELFVPLLQQAFGVSRRAPGSREWTLVHTGMEIAPELLVRDSTGVLYAARRNQGRLYRLPAGESVWEELERPWSEWARVNALEIGPGDLLHVALEDAASSQLHRRETDGSWTAVGPAVPGVRLNYVAVAADGAIFVSEDMFGVRIRGWTQGASDWTILGEPRPGTDVRLETLADGSLVAAGMGVWKWNGSDWSDLASGLPSCGASTCAIRSLAISGTGDILVTSNGRVYERPALGSAFAMRGNELPSVSTQGPLVHVAIGEEGAIYAAGIPGVWRLGAGEAAWDPVRVAGLPGVSWLSSFARSQDGTLAAAPNGIRYTEGGRQLFVLEGEAWIGYGSTLSGAYPLEAQSITFAPDGSILFPSWSTSMFRLPAGEGALEQLLEIAGDFGSLFPQQVVSDGAGWLYASTSSFGSALHRLAPDATAWQMVPVELTSVSLLRDRAGGVWGLSSEGPFRIASGGGAPVFHGGFSPEASWVHSLAEGPDGSLWAATEEGPYLFDGEAELWRPVGAGLALPVNRIAAGPGGVAYATANAGFGFGHEDLFELSPETGAWVLVEEGLGGGSGAFAGIEVADDGVVYAGHRQLGVLRADPL